MRLSFVRGEPTEHPMPRPLKIKRLAMEFFDRQLYPRKHVPHQNVTAPSNIRRCLVLQKRPVALRRAIFFDAIILDLV